MGYQRNHQQLDSVKNRESGYAMLSLLAAMTIMAIAVGSAMPSIRHESQRQHEEEMFWNGSQVATALGMYYLVNKRYPTRLEDLTKPITAVPGQGSTNTQPITFHLRAWAMTDPMTGEPWKIVRAGDPIINEFIQTHNASIGASAMTASPQYIPIQSIQGYFQSLLASGVVITNQSDEQSQQSSFSKSSNFSLSPENRPIVGVISRSTQQPIRNYYGISRYDQCLILAAWCQGGKGCQVLKMPISDQLSSPALNVVSMGVPQQLPNPVSGGPKNEE